MRFLVLLTIIFLSSCMGTTIEVDDSLRFEPTGHGRYAWTNDPMVDTTGRQELIFRGDAILRDLVNTILQQRGYQMVPREQASFLVDYRYIRTMKADQGGVISPTDEMAASWDLGGDVNNTELHNHSVNAYVMHSELKLVLTDLEDNALWRARSSRLVDNESPSDDALRKTLGKITRKMFRGFPEAN